MSFLRKLFGGAPRLDGMALATSAVKSDYAQIALLAEFHLPRVRHDKMTQQLWSRTLPQPYEASLALFQKLDWLTVTGDHYQVTDEASPFVVRYQERQAAEKAAILPKVRAAIAARDTSEALSLRREYEARQPIGQADWTGPEPQLSHSALTRRILFLEHWLLDGLSADAIRWLKNYAAEEHLWGAYWQLTDEEIPPTIREELRAKELSAAEAAYWRAYQLALYVDNQETWQRCKGGDHVRRLEIVGPDDDATCDVCRQFLGKQYLVARVPELPHRDCESPYGCRCRYEPVLESYEE